MLSAQDAEQLRVMVKDVLTSQENDKLIRQLMTDPKFAGDFAKAIQKETKQLHKDLLKDPEYQKALIEAMKSPEYEKMIFDVLKSAQYRQQVMTIMQEALQSPLYRMELMELMKKVVEEGVQPQAPQGEKQQQGQGGKGGGGGGKQEGGS
jgi:spore germination protein D